MSWIIYLLIGGGVLWALWPSPPYMNPIPDAAFLTHSLQMLLKLGVHRAGVIGTMTVCLREAPTHRLVFTKQIDDGGEIGFRAEFTRELWAEPHYEKYRAELDRRGVRYDVVYRTGTRSLVFALGRDFGGAYVVTRILFEDVLGARLHRDCVLYFRDTLIRNVPRLTGVKE